MSSIPSRSDSSAFPQVSLHAHRMMGLVLIGFVVVYVIWGSTYLAIRIGIESFPPLLLAGTRHLAVGLVLYPLVRWNTQERPTWEQ